MRSRQRSCGRGLQPKFADTVWICCRRKSPGQEVPRKKPDTFWFEEKGGLLKPVPPSFSTIFQPSEKGGEQSVCQQKKRNCGTNRHKPAQTGTNRHKPAQTGTYFVPAQILRGAAHLPPFHCLLLQSAASVHRHGWVGDPGTSTGWQREERGESGNGLAAKGQTWPPPHRRHHICRSCLCGPILLPLPWLLLATAPPPLTTSHHCYWLVDCWIVRAANAMLSASYLLLLSSLSQPHFGTYPPSPPSRSLSKHRLPHWRLSLHGWRGRPPLSLLATLQQTTAMASRHCCILIHDVTKQGNNLGVSICLFEKKMALRHKMAQTGTNRHKFLCWHNI